MMSKEDNERRKAKTDGSMCLVYTGLCGELEQLTIETMLIGESFECVMGHGVCDLVYYEQQIKRELKRCDLEVIGDLCSRKGVCLLSSE